LTPAEKTHEHPPVAEPDDSAEEKAGAKGGATQADVKIEGDKKLGPRGAEKEEKVDSVKQAHRLEV